MARLTLYLPLSPGTSSYGGLAESMVGHGKRLAPRPRVGVVCPAMGEESVLFIAIVFSGGVVALLMSLGQLLIRGRNRGNILLFGIYGVIAGTQFQAILFNWPGAATNLPHLIQAGPLWRMLLGPLVWLFFREVLLRDLLRRRWLHFVPTLFFLGGALPFFLLDLALLAGLLDADCGLCDWSGFFQGFMAVGNVGANILLAVYLGPLVLFLVKSRLDLASGRRLIRAVNLVLGLSLLAVVMNFGDNFTDYAIFDGAGSVILSLIVFVVFLMGYTYPEVLHVMRMEAFEQERRASPLKKLDTARLDRELRRLMAEEKLYCDEDLQLGGLAAALEIRPNQLTYFLNRVYEKNFAAFVNEYRINEARQLLLDEPKRSVLSIGYAVGFNSKTAFYRVFQDLTGRSPAEFRKQGG